MMEIIYLVVAIIILIIISPYLIHITNLFTSLVPDQLLLFLGFVIAIKIVLFIIHRGDEG